MDARKVIQPQLLVLFNDFKKRPGFTNESRPFSHPAIFSYFT